MHTLMKIERLLFACILLVACSFVAMNALAGEQIFKTVDADGNVVFTDVPPRANQPAEPVNIVAPNTFPARADPAQAEGRQQWIVEPETDEEAEAAAAPYYSLTIVNPSNDEDVRENAGNVRVRAQLQPPLRAGHTMQLLLDNTPVATAGRDATFALSNLDRGTHTVQAQVLDNNGAVVFAGDPSTFHLQRYSVLNAPSRPSSAPNRSN